MKILFLISFIFFSFISFSQTNEFDSLEIRPNILAKTKKPTYENYVRQNVIKIDTLVLKKDSIVIKYISKIGSVIKEIGFNYIAPINNRPDFLAKSDSIISFFNPAGYKIYTEWWVFFSHIYDSPNDGDFKLIQHNTPFLSHFIRIEYDKNNCDTLTVFASQSTSIWRVRKSCVDTAKIISSAPEIIKLSQFWDD